MSDPQRPTAREVELINAHVHPPMNGTIVHALNHGGVLCFNVIWNSASIRDYDAYMLTPKVPEDVKAIQSARFATAAQSDTSDIHLHHGEDGNAEVKQSQAGVSGQVSGHAGTET